MENLLEFVKISIYSRTIDLKFGILLEYIHLSNFTSIARLYKKISRSFLKIFIILRANFLMSLELNRWEMDSYFPKQIWWSCPVLSICLIWGPFSSVWYLENDLTSLQSKFTLLQSIFFTKYKRKIWREKNYSSKVNVLYKNPLSKKEEGFEEKGFLI